MSFKVNISEFNKSITFQRFIVEKDKDNRPIKKWVDLYTTRAKITGVSGKEFIEYYTDTAEIVKNFHVRYRRDSVINNKDRIVYKGNNYEIDYVNNYDEANEWLIIRAKVVK